MEIAFVLSEVRRRPILSCFSLLLFTPPMFRMLLFFFPLLLSTALCVLALVSLGPHLSATENSGTHRGKDMFDGHMHGFPDEDWQPDLENEQETSTLQYIEGKKKQSKWDDGEVSRDQWQDGVAEEETTTFDKAGKNVEEAGTPKVEECFLEKDEHCPEKNDCSLDCAFSSHEMSDMIKESPTDEKDACEDKQESGDVEKEKSAEMKASAVSGSEIDEEDVCNSGNKHSCEKSRAVAGVEEASEQECEVRAEVDGSGRHSRSWDVRRRYSNLRPCSLDCSSSIFYSHMNLVQHDDLSSHDMVRGYETSFDPWESSMWVRDFLHEEANIPVR